jgi:hypothetical protein
MSSMEDRHMDSYMDTWVLVIIKFTSKSQSLAGYNSTGLKQNWTNCMFYDSNGYIILADMSSY